MPLTYDRCLDLLDEQAERMLLVLAEADAQRPCPTCPPWTLDDLAAHLGRVYAWVATIISSVSPEPPSRDALPTQPESQPGDEWLRERYGILATLLREMPRDAIRWNFVAGTAAPVAFWPRRQLHETAIHRVDAELGAGQSVVDLDPAAAADAIPEYLAFTGFRQVTADEIDLAGDPLTVHFHITDVDGAEWTVDSGNRTYAAAHLKADVAVRGPAWVVDQWCWGRVTSDDPRLEIFGDLAALDIWRPTR